MSIANDLIMQHGENSDIYLLTPETSKLVTDPTQLSQWFLPDYWRNQNAVTGQSRGRNTVWFVQHDAQEWVLRHYYRGGLPGRLVRDQFFYTGVSQTRSFAELNLLWRMQQLGLPVPKPIAARVQKKGLIYRADILIERITPSYDLFQRLQHSPLAENQWQDIGATIARFHSAGVFHSDLNCHNILLQCAEPSDKVWVLDFDRCDIRDEGDWQGQNLARLHRSLRKEQQKMAQQGHGEFNFSEEDWQYLVQGYGQFRSRPNEQHEHY